MGLSIGHKVANKGTTPEGRLTAEEVNLIVQAINSGPADVIVTGVDVGYAEDFVFLIFDCIKSGEKIQKVVKLKAASANLAGVMTAADKVAMSKVHEFLGSVGDLNLVLDKILYG